MLKMKQIAIFIVVLSVLFSAATGCQPGFQPGTYTDDMGREVNIEETPQRIVSHVPPITEILFALDLDERIVGVSDFCDYPEEARAKPSVGNYFNPSIESIVALNPDLVLTDGHSDSIQQLDNLGINYLVIDPKDIDDIFEDIELLGNVIGIADRAGKLIDDMKADISSITGRVKDARRVKVFYVIDATDLNNPWTAGPGSFVDSLISLAGGENIASGAVGAWTQFSIEQIISSDPEIIILPAAHGTAFVSTGLLEEHPAWRETTAVRQDGIHIIDGDLVDGYGPRIVQGLEEMARIIHPELFP